MQFKDKKCLIFDLDGTLINSAPDLALAVNFMLHTLGRETFSEAVIDLWVGNGATTLVHRALSGAAIVDESIDNAFIAKALAIFLQSYKENVCVKTVLYPDVHSSLKSLHSLGYTMAIVTNKPFEFVNPILKKLALDNFFSLVLGGDSLAKRKPEPDPLLHVALHFGVTSKECLMIGDSKNDILAANAANMQSIGVSYGYNYGESIALYNPTIVVPNFVDIVEALTKK